MLIVKISPTVTADQRNDSRFTRLLREAQAFFNCRKQCCFNTTFREDLCLHEGAHAYFARQAGATNIKFHGPEMCWDSRPEYDCPAISKASVSWDEPLGCFGIEAAKADLAGFICRREMSDTPNDEIAIGVDLAVCRDRFDRYIGGGDDAFNSLIGHAERSILTDLKSPKVQQEIRHMGKQFEREIFSAPQLTSEMLRAKGIGWMH
jgi:hypothetical protein